MVTMIGTELDDIITPTQISGFIALKYPGLEPGVFSDTLSGMGGNDTLDGGEGSDSLSGGAGNDVLYGGEGSDTLNGGAGSNLLKGGNGSDTYTLNSTSDIVQENGGALGGIDRIIAGFSITLAASVEHLTLTGTGNFSGTGNAGNNRLEGNSGQNILRGNDGNDTLDGQAGNDTLDGGSGNDRMLGGTGSDIYFVDSTNDSLVEQAGEGLDTVRATARYTLAKNIENLILDGSADIGGFGNTSDNVITGNAGRNSLSGNDGADHLLGLDGSDTLFGGNGDDLMEGGSGDDWITGDAGNDTLLGGTGGDVMRGGFGDDTFEVDSAADRVFEDEAEGTDLVRASIGHVLSDNVENLTLTGAAAINGTGNGLNNRIDGNGASNTLSGLGGNDELRGLGGSDTLFGGDGNDDLDGQSGVDRLEGGDGNDILRGGADADILQGGLGNDTYALDGTSATVTEAADGGQDRVVASVTVTLSDNVEELFLIGNDALAGTGNTLDNLMVGNSGNNALGGLDGNDRLFGGAGNDTLFGDSGNDRMFGGVGNDTFLVDVLGDEAVDIAGGGIDTVRSRVSWTLFAEIENFVATGAGQVNAVGNALNNTLSGNMVANSLGGMDGSDTLIGNGGNDTLDGGTGADSMAGGTGDDTYIVDSAQDIAVDVLDGGNDLVLSTAVSFTLGDHIERLVLQGAGVATGIGNALANRIEGNDATNILLGMDGNDTLLGGGGSDDLRGGLGTNSMAGGAGNDIYTVTDLLNTVTEVAGEGNDQVRSTVTFTIGAEVERLTLLGLGSVNGTGNAGNNILIGNAGDNVLGGVSGNDTLIGGDGNDQLNGGTGNDQMSGGAGNDVYIVDSALDDVIELADQGRDRVVALISVTLADNVEVLELIGAPGLTGRGNGLANLIVSNVAGSTLEGLGGSDTLIGGAGADRLVGGSGVDAMVGGFGDDTYVVDNAAESVTEAPGQGDDHVLASSNFTLGLNIERLTLTGTGGISGDGNELGNAIIGNGSDNTLRGWDGADTLTGGGGNDLLIGGTGLDTLVGGTGNDTYNVESLSEVVTELADEGTDTVRVLGNYSLGANIENLVVSDVVGIGTFVAAVGNGLDNTMTGHAGNNLLSGGAGNDTLNGGAGNDTLSGGTNDDQLFADVGNDVLQGGDGADDLNGWDGADQVEGGAGVDQLTGGLGIDTFIFDISNLSEIDSIRDLQIEDEVSASVPKGLSDIIDLTRIDANAILAGDQAFSIVGSGVGTLNLLFTVDEMILRGNIDNDADFELQIDITGYTTSIDLQINLTPDGLVAFRPLTLNDLDVFL